MVFHVLPPSWVRRIRPLTLPAIQQLFTSVHVMPRIQPSVLAIALLVHVFPPSVVLLM